MKIKLLSVLLALIMVLSMLAACAQETEKDPAADPGNNNPQTPDTEDDPPAEEEKLLPNLPAIDFNQAEFHCLHWNLDSIVGGNWVPWEEIAIEDPTGDMLDDQVWRRNSYVEETYNVVITTEYCMANTEMPTKIRAATSTNDDTYQMMVQRSANLTSMWTEGLFYNLRGEEMHHIDLEQPWWNQSSVETFTFGNVTQFAASEMLLLDKSETGCVFFSTVLQNDFSLPNFYEMVEEGEWTWEALRESAEIVVDDLNGDDVMDANDRWGSSGNRAPLPYLYVASGYSFAEIDEDGHIFTTIGEDESIDFLVEIHDEMIYQDSHAHSDVIPDFGIAKKFKANEVLFTYYSVKMSNNLRDMESNYGILPMPKYDKYQDNYYNLIMPDGDSVIGVPISCGDTELTSLVIEALSAESYYTVYPAFYDVVLMSKFTRDAESQDMLKIIFDTRVYDIGAIYGLGNYHGQLITYAATHYGDSNIASLYAANENAITASIKQLNDLIDQWNE
ncbi:MAG: hypothetical protein IJW40_01055 [Clostridia bacterium]|nr:hypothetical protein [Clostridia bacterium]